MVGLARDLTIVVGLAALLAAPGACGSSADDGADEPLTQSDYDEVADAYLECIASYIPEAELSYDANRTYPGGEMFYDYTVGVPGTSDSLDEVDPAMRACETEVADFIGVSAAWEQQLATAYPDAFADIDFERVGECLREGGIELEDTSTASLDAAIAADPELYETCYDLEVQRVLEANAPG